MEHPEAGPVNLSSPVRPGQPGKISRGNAVPLVLPGLSDLTADSSQSSFFVVFWLLVFF